MYMYVYFNNIHNNVYDFNNRENYYGGYVYYLLNFSINIKLF